MSNASCLWCRGPFEAVKRGAHVKKFCGVRCKTAFETAARRWVYSRIEAGDLSVSDLKALSPSRATPGAAGKGPA